MGERVDEVANDPFLCGGDSKLRSMVVVRSAPSLLLPLKTSRTPASVVSAWSVMTPSGPHEIWVDYLHEKIESPEERPRQWIQSSSVGFQARLFKLSRMCLKGSRTG